MAAGRTPLGGLPPPGAGAAADQEADGDGDAEPLQPAELVVRCARVALGVGLVALAAGAVLAGHHVSRALAVLLLGGTGLAIGRLAVRTVAILWTGGIRPQHGITVEAQPVLTRGAVAHGYTAADGKLRTAPGMSGQRGETYHVAYHPEHPARSVACSGTGELFTWLPFPVVFTAVTVLIGWGTVALALTAFR
ncbi:hypothetical protein ACLQ2E_16330 [Streptomyces lavendulocolor]